jgi:hypothetical protein
MADQQNLDSIRRDFREFLTRDSDMDYGIIESAENCIREKLKLAGLTAAALDETGQKSAAEMDAALVQAGRDNRLRCARKLMHTLETTTVPHDHETADRFIKEIRDQLAQAGRDITALDPAGKQDAAEIEARFAAGKRRMCLQKARRDFADFEKTNTAGWVMLIGHIVTRVRENMARAGEPLSALDPTGASSDADIEARIAAAARRIKIVDMQSKLTEAEKDRKYVTSIDDVNRPRADINKALAELGLGMESLDPTCKATAAEMEQRLAKAEQRLAACGAMHAAEALEEYASGKNTPFAGSSLMYVKNLEMFIEKAGGVEKLATSEENRRRVAVALVTGSYGAVEDEMKEFERMQAPKSLKEVDARLNRVAELFNRASEIFKAKATDGHDPAVELQARVNSADERARRLYYAGGGRIPVMKRIKLGGTAGSGT